MGETIELPFVVKLPVRAWERTDEEDDGSEAGIDEGQLPTPQSEEELTEVTGQIVHSKGKPSLLRGC